MEMIGKEKEIEKRPSIFKNRNFVLLFFATLFASPGYYMYLIGAEWLMLSLDDNRFYFGMLFIAASIPRLLFMTVGGVLADRVNKRTIIFVTDLVRACLGLLVLYFVWSGTVTVWHLITIAAIFGMADAFSHPATGSIVPTLIPKEQLQRGNSLVQMMGLVSPILGPALGGTLIATTGFIGVFAAAALFLIIASVLIAMIQIKNEAAEEVVKSSAWDDFKAGFHYVRNHQLMGSIFVTALFINFFFVGPIVIGLPIIVKDIFAGTAGHLAFLEGSMGVGALIGTITLVAITLKKYGKVLIGSLFFTGFLYLCIGLSPSIYFIGAILLGMGVLLQFVNIPIMTVIQKETDPKMLGRMASMLALVSTGLIPVSYLVTSTLISMGVGMQSIVVVSGVVIMVIALYNVRNKVLLNI